MSSAGGGRSGRVILEPGLACGVEGSERLDDADPSKAFVSSMGNPFLNFTDFLSDEQVAFPEDCERLEVLD